MLNKDQLVALTSKIAVVLEEANFPTTYGWPDKISMALLDAVFSIRSVYSTKNETGGVLGRVKTFRDNHTDAVDDLQLLVELGAEEITRIMGATKTGQRPKAECVIEAAQNFVALGVRHARDFEAKNPEHQAAYLGVHGLGKVTYEYFGMLLGNQGIKADSQLFSFVNQTLAENDLPAVSQGELRAALVQVFEQFENIEFTAFDHAIWSYQSKLSKQQRGR